MGYVPGKAWKQARQIVDSNCISPTLTAEMGFKGNNFVWIVEESKDDFG